MPVAGRPAHQHQHGIGINTNLGLMLLCSTLDGKQECQIKDHNVCIRHTVELDAEALWGSPDVWESVRLYQQQNRENRIVNPRNREY